MKIYMPVQFLIFSLAAASPMMAGAGKNDAEWESQIAQKLAEEVIIGDVIWCKTGRGNFLALFNGQPARQARGAAILLHGMGAHPDWPEIIAPLRLALPDREWSTLSVQLPVLEPGIPVAAYGETVQEAGQRISAAVRWLQDRDYHNIVIIGHGFGAATAASYIAGNDDNGILAFVGIGLRSQKFLNPLLEITDLLAKINVPILDVYGSRDFNEVIRSAADRRLAASKNGNHVYRQIEIKDADQNFTGLESALVNRIGDWLDHVAQNTIVTTSDNISVRSEQHEVKKSMPETGSE